MTTDIYNTGISTLQHSFFNSDKEQHDIITPEQAREIFGFKVSKEQSYRFNGTPIPNQFHLVRRNNDEDDGIVIGSTGVGSEFSVDVQPIDVLNFFLDQIMPEIPQLSLETVASMRDGATTFANLHFGDAYSLPNDESKHYTNILFMNPLTKGCIKLLTHTVRVVCMNTLKMAQDEGTGFTVAHTMNSRFYVEAALDLIKQEIAQASILKELSFKLDSMQITQKNIGAILDKVYPIKQNKKGEDSTRDINLRKAVMEQFEKDGTFRLRTAWAFLNAMTFGVQHQKETQKRNFRDMEFDNLVGSRASLKSRMLGAVVNEMGLAA